MRDAHRRALPALGQRQRLAVEVAVHAVPGERADPFAEREAAPGRDVDRRHRLAVAGDRTGRADADGGDAHPVAVGGLQLLVDDPGQLREVGLGADVVVDEHDGPVDELALGTDQSGGELGAADVDGQDDLGQLRRRRHRRRRVGHLVAGLAGRLLLVFGVVHAKSRDR